MIFIFRNIIKTLLLALRYSFIVNSQHYIFNRNSALQFFVDAMLWSPISHQFLVAADSRDLTFWYEIEWREERLYWFSFLSRSLFLSFSLSQSLLQFIFCWQLTKSFILLSFLSAPFASLDRSLRTESHYFSFNTFWKNTFLNSIFRVLHKLGVTRNRYSSIYWFWNDFPEWIKCFLLSKLINL